MGKLIVTEFISLDGIIEDPGGNEGTEHGGWSFRSPAPESEQFKANELQASDVQLLGRTTYEGFAAAWPAMEEATGEFGKKMNAMPKVVVSTTLTEATWNNTTIIRDNVPGEVARLKDQYRATSWSREARHSPVRCKSTVWSMSTTSWCTPSCSARASASSVRTPPGPLWTCSIRARSAPTCSC